MERILVCSTIGERSTVQFGVCVGGSVQPFISNQLNWSRKMDLARGLPEINNLDWAMHLFGHSWMNIRKGRQSRKSEKRKTIESSIRFVNNKMIQFSPIDASNCQDKRKACEQHYWDEKWRNYAHWMLYIGGCMRILLLTHSPDLMIFDSSQPLRYTLKALDFMFYILFSVSG